MKKNCVKAALCALVFLSASILFAQEVEDEPKREKDGLQKKEQLLMGNWELQQHDVTVRRCVCSWRKRLYHDRRIHKRKHRKHGGIAI